MNDPDRYVALDAIRGFAVMGILLMNIVAFALPEAAYFNPLAYGHEGPADLWVWAVNFVLVDGKMRGLFSMLFGASMLLVIERAEAAGQDPAAVHFRRMAWLLVFGLIHFYLIWWGDILQHYAIIGCIAYLFRESSVRALLWTGAVAFAIQIVALALLWTSFAAMQAEALAPGASAETLATWEGIVNQFGVPPGDVIARDLALYRGPWLGMAREQLGKHLTEPLETALFIGPETLGLMLFGMAAYKSGFLAGRWPMRAYARTMLAAYAAGLPLAAMLAWAIWANGFDTLSVFGLGFAAPTPLQPVVMLGHAALAMLLIQRFRDGALVARLAAAGQAAFTNYLGTSILMVLLFYGYGLGFYGDWSRTQVYLVVPVVWAIMLLWSKPWLDRFRYGPLEWLWRSLARGEPQLMRR